jgi:hypothetical protein
MTSRAVLGQHLAEHRAHEFSGLRDQHAAADEGVLHRKSLLQAGGEVVEA